MRTSLFAALLTLFAFSSLARATDAPNRSISTTGEAIVYATPNEVIVNFGIETFNASLDEAKAANDAAAAKLVRAIKDLGIKEENIGTDTLQVQIEYKDRVHNGVAGYITRRSYGVKLKDTKLFEKLVETGLKNGANQLNGVTFQTTDLCKHRDEARKLAIKAAKEKAAALAIELTCKVGKPITISEGSSYSYGGWNRYNSQAQNSESFQPPAGESAETLPLGQIAIQASVSVSFDLLPIE